MEGDFNKTGDLVVDVTDSASLAKNADISLEFRFKLTSVWGDIPPLLEAVWFPASSVTL